MLDQEKSKEELIAELEELRRHVNRLDSYRYAGEGTSSLVNFHNTAFGESIGYAFEPTKEHITKLILFVSQGLEQNEKVLFIADKYSQETFEKALASHCPELDTLKNNHQFCLQQHTCFFIDEDRFSAPYAIEKISEIAQNAKAEGFSGLRIYHELTWEIKESNSLNSTFEYIQELNKYMGKTKCIALISYDQTLLPLDTILKTIRLHHKFIIRGELYDNIFYVEPELWDDSHHQTLSDISEFRYILNSLKAHKQIVNNLHETQNFLSLIFKNSEMSIFIVNVLKNGEYIYEGINPAHEKIVGISHKQICGKSPQALKQIYGEEAVNYIYELYDECVSKRETITSEFYVPQGPAKGWWLSSLTPLFNEQGNVTQILGNGMIITKQKELETKLQANKAQLEKIVKDHNINIKVPSR